MLWIKSIVDRCRRNLSVKYGHDIQEVTSFSIILKYGGDNETMEIVLAKSTLEG